MAAADVFVFPSLFEGSAVVTYEALACGLPCIVTPRPGSVVRDGVEGLIVPARDVEALAAAWNGSAATRGSARDLAAAARPGPRRSTGPATTTAVLDAIDRDRRPLTGRSHGPGLHAVAAVTHTPQPGATNPMN